MNYKRIVAFGLTLFLLRFVVGVTVGYFGVDLDSSYRFAVLYGADSLVVVPVFTMLAARQVRRLLVHVVLVIAIEQALLLLTALGLKALIGLETGPIPLLAIEYCIFFASVCIGIVIGRRVQPTIS